MNVIWGRRARRDLYELISYLAEESVKAAEVVTDRLDRGADLLSLMPRAGRPGRINGTRELVVLRTPYILVHRIKRSVLEIIRVYHGKRRWPARFD